jgi:site-specific DNA-methyltransferase (adenine-specific)
VSKAIEKNERGDLVRAKLVHFATTRGVDGKWLEAHGVASASSFADWTIGGHVPSDRNWQLVRDALEVTPAEESAFEREVISEGTSRVDDGTVYGLGHSGRRLGGAVTHTAQQWQGWGTALKPAFEPIVVGRKPLSGTVAGNVLTHGTGALNIDGCRIDGNGERFGGGAKGSSGFVDGYEAGAGFVTSTQGRWPANVVLDGDQADELDRQSGTLTSGVLAAHHARAPKDAGILGAYGSAEGERGYGDTGGASRFFPTFRYEAKAPTAERPRHGEVAHPTVKPLDLMRWLVRLVTPPGGVVLEPFAGSGTTAEACVIEGFRCIAIEREAAYLPLIVARLSKPIQVDLFGGAA